MAQTLQYSEESTSVIAEMAGVGGLDSEEDKVGGIDSEDSEDKVGGIDSEEDKVGGIDSEEDKVERSTRLIWGPGEEGFGAYRPPSRYGPLYSPAKVNRRSKTLKVGKNGVIKKYWFQRYSLFAKYDKGIKMDEEGWFSVTPEAIAKHQASRCATRRLILDAFTGVGGNAIQFAMKSHHVIAIDIDPVKIECARHNAKIYGVADKITFIVGDFFKLAPYLEVDVVFLSPPWGGPGYLDHEVYDLHTMLQPWDGCTLFKVARSVASKIALFVPRNVDLNQLHELAWLTDPPLPCEVEYNFLNNKVKAITAYYGDLARPDVRNYADR